MNLFENYEKNKMNNNAPLADRIRPERLKDFLGKDKIICPGKPLRQANEEDKLQSILLWGPPGSGKTTLARIIAKMTKTHFVPFSAAILGVPALRKIIKEAQDRRRYHHQGTILFVDEIHRFSKAQQDAVFTFLEDGTIILIGATTENPSFEVIPPLLSRSTVYILEPLSPEDLKNILEKALLDKEKGLGKYKLKLEPKVLDFIVELAYGDARIALNILEFAVITTKPEIQGIRNISLKIIEEVVQKRCLRYDKNGEEHYNIISALHKSMRDSDPDAAIYWVARMLEAGENPLYVARRLVRFASEDIKRWGPLPVPLVIRNAPTPLMKDLGYGEGYKYAHNFEGGYIVQEHLPKELKGRKYYFPADRGFEKQIKQRLEKLKAKH